MHWSLLLPNLPRASSLLLENRAHFLFHWWATLSVSLTASLLSLLVALVASFLTIRFRFLGAIISPLVALSQSFPLQSIAPLLIIAMGIGYHTKVAIAFIISFFPIYVSCVTALKTVPAPIVAFLTVCNAQPLKSIWHGRFPAALPAIISAAKVGFTLAVLGAVVAEFIQPDKGIGHLLLLAQSNYDVDIIYICIFLLILQGLTVYGVLSWAEHVVIEKRRADE
jgi:NitT/TauT family transport system permease protein